ncbi:hypothetical protein PUNSTDRAFT_143725 [Punctularia strigosozonata HHB-11173 SS5]|uniref:uncharacterized protein n=1 Tax=Punctularia strigosozonata (strain HHB-11173) TaxID=741275 RepID=UPI000441821C|nr:uncharacterized protein PUNSTDRAFT_143725 [Punctularia strigosozonata HHB-11173 SS5]EIN09140.1 hypothetical protein PUNSTDRAFT_143725 [Punctularia strigosozonata HHB-11173 SS5]
MARRNAIQRPTTHSPNRSRNGPRQPPAHPPQPTATPDATNKVYIWETNLKMIRRREPTVQKLFDCFHHVALYSCEPTTEGEDETPKWEKMPYEGSMFLFQREDYPHYGYYILNRVGGEDWVSYIYPEDNIDGPDGSSYTYHYTYPDFTRARMARIYGRPPTPRSDARAVRDVPRKAKLRKVIYGLWMHVTPTREPLTTVLPRLLHYIKRGKPYPEKYQYGPYREPPPHGQAPEEETSVLQNASRSDSSSTREHGAVSGAPRRVYVPASATSIADDAEDELEGEASYSWVSDEIAPSDSISAVGAQSQDRQQPPQYHMPQRHGQSLSEVDRLFFNMNMNVGNSAVTAPAALPNLNTEQKLTVEGLFAAVSGTGNAHTGSTTIPIAQPPQPPQALEPQAVPHSGPALLASIFASATAPAPASHTAPTHTAHIAPLVGSDLNQSFRFPPPPSTAHSTTLPFPISHSSTLSQPSYAQNAGRYPQSQQSQLPQAGYVTNSQTQTYPSSHLPDPEQVPQPSTPQHPGPAPSIVSPRPTQGSVPQILTQDVIYSLMGLRSGSASSASSSAVGHASDRGGLQSGQSSLRSGYSSTTSGTSRRSTNGSSLSRSYGDNELDSGGPSTPASEAGLSESSTVLDVEDLADISLQSAGASAGVPLLAVPGLPDLNPDPGFAHGRRATGASLHGDATPRMVSRPMPTQSTSSPPPEPRGSGSAKASGIGATAKRSEFLTSNSSSSSLNRTPRVAASSLPGPSTQAEEVMSPPATDVPMPPRFGDSSELWPQPLHDGATRIDGIVELDFADTSVLSDPDAFDSAAAGRHKTRDKGRKAGGIVVNGYGDTATGQKEKGKKKAKRSEGQASDSLSSIATHSQPLPNGAPSSKIPSNSNSDAAIDTSAARDALLQSVLAQVNGNFKGLSRNDFVREILTLIHTDKNFIDRMYRDYLERAA